MTDDMPRVLPPFVYREKTRHGKIVFYFRKGKGNRVRLPALGSPQFEDAYHDLLTALGPRALPRGTSGTMEWLIARYQETAAYHALSPATRRQRDNIFKGVIAKSGSARIASINEASIGAGKDARASTPSQARNFLDAMRGLFRWAVSANHVTRDPTAAVKNPPRPAGDGFTPWTEDDVQAFERHWPAGTKERVWMHVLLYTGLRRGDAVRLGKQHVRDGIATLKTEKGRKRNVEVSIPILPLLARTLAVGPTGDLAYIVGANGRPLTKETFGNMFRAACNAAKVWDKSAHGLRKIAATRAAEAGATVNELEAWFGWEGGAMASLYTRAANRKRLAMQLGDRIGNANARTTRGRRPAPKKSAI